MKVQTTCHDIDLKITKVNNGIGYAYRALLDKREVGIYPSLDTAINILREDTLRKYGHSLFDDRIDQRDFSLGKSCFNPEAIRSFYNEIKNKVLSMKEIRSDGDYNQESMEFQRIGGFIYMRGLKFYPEGIYVSTKDQFLEFSKEFFDPLIEHMCICNQDILDIDFSKAYEDN